MQSNILKTSYIQREPSDVFASVLTESVQKSIDKNSYGDPVTVTVKVEKNHSRTYELSETERSKLETAMFPTE